MPASKRPRHAHQVRPLRIPMMDSTRDEFAMQLHLALEQMRRMPTVDAYDAIGGILNVVQVAIRNEVRFKAEARVITSGAAAMQAFERKVGAGLPLRDHELAPLQAAVNQVDELLPRLSVTALHQAAQEVRLLARERAGAED